MEKRIVAFLALSFALMAANMWFWNWMNPRPPGVVAQVGAAPDGGAGADVPAGAEDGVAGDGQKDQKEPDDKPAPDQNAPPDAQPDVANPPAAPAPPRPLVPAEWITLGSADPNSPFRMLVTLTNRGAAVERIELNSDRYHDLGDETRYQGYLGQLVHGDAPGGAGCVIHVVGPGTPAGDAGLLPGDVIVAVGGTTVTNAEEFDAALSATHPGDVLSLQFERGGKEQSLDVPLRYRPLELVRPEGEDALAVHAPDSAPRSFLLTLDRLDDREVADGEDELRGLDLRTANWEVLPRASSDEVAFSYVVPGANVEIIKRFRLVPSEAGDGEGLGYHLDFNVELKNHDDKPHDVAYRLDGPIGLPTEGWWYSNKISPNWMDAAGARDVVVSFLHEGYVEHSLFSCSKINQAPTDVAVVWRDEPMVYIGVDTQFFLAALVPKKERLDELWFERSMPLRVTPAPTSKKLRKLTNVSFRVASNAAKLDPGGAVEHEFTLFAGPKKPDILANYGLGKCVYYGWFGWVSKPMLSVLHFFYAIVRNYGISIILLTVLVRSSMFPISRKQALNAQKMQEIQPEIKKLTEKYKGNMEARTKAQQELFRKHNYNPLSGCLPMFLQFPIFIGLYRSLAVDVELRQATLLGQAIGWCANLAGPDMLFRWDSFMPAFFSSPVGWLGPYFNVLPVLTMTLMISQQKMFMPPPADDQAALQQKMMRYMMIFFGVMFFKVASGLCLYFIVSSSWGIAERKLLPRTKAAEPPPVAKSAKKNGKKVPL